jgi:beta-lactamase regulating signal transducer with metallopeptidase domain
MNAFSEFFSLTGWIILHSLWQVFLVWGVFALGARWISANRPQARYRFMMFGLMAMACQPILCLGIGIVVAPVQQLLGPITNAGTATFEVSQAEFAIEKKAEPEESKVHSSRNELLLRNMEHKAIHQWQPLENWLPILGKLWLLGAILLSSRMVVGYLGLSRLRRSAMPPSSLESAILHRLLESSRFHGSVRIARSAQVSVPLVIGFLRPMILMPLAMSTGLKPLELEMILAHELAHLRRYDLWANAFQLTVETLFFYHPCVWHLSRRIRLERELCCDALAADDIEKKAALGRALLAIETNRGNPKILALAACDGDLLHRVRVLSQLPIERPTGWSLLASGMSLGVIVLSALLVIANDDAPQSDQPLPKVSNTSISENDTNPAAVESKHRVAGRVVDSNGNPIPDAFVLLDVHSSGMGHPTLEFHADSKGQFTIDYSGQVRDDVQFPDTYLWAIADGFNLTCVRPYHSPNGPLECEIRLMPEEQIAVHVWNAAGAGVVEPFF